MWKNFGRPTARQATDDNTRRRNRFVCWITKAAKTHSEYVILTVYPRQLWLGEHNSVLPFIRTLHVLFGHWVAEWQIKRGGGVYSRLLFGWRTEKKSFKIEVSEFIITVVEFSFPLPLPSVISQFTSMLPCQSKKCHCMVLQLACNVLCKCNQNDWPIFLRT